MEKIRELRKINNIKRNELAELLNVTPATISNYENGYRDPGIRELIILADFFNVSIDYLVGRKEILKEKSKKVFYVIEKTIIVPSNMDDGEIDLIIKDKTKGHKYKWSKNNIL